MTQGTSDKRPSFYKAARTMGVTFSHEAIPLDQFVAANGLRVHYLDWGNPNNPTVLLLHGFAQTCHSWDFVALSLSDRFRVIALDQRGHGDTDWPLNGDYSTEARQKDIEEIVGALNINDFVLMGLSMGGRTAFTYASRHPEKVKALVIVDASPDNQRAGTENIRRFVEQGDELDSIDDFIERVRRYNPRRPVDQIRGSILHNLKQLSNGKWTWKYDKLLRSPERQADPDPTLTKRLWAYLERLQCPTLVVRGAESDIVAQETAEAMCLRIAQGRLATIEKAGHLVMGDNAAGFERAIKEFLSGLF